MKPCLPSGITCRFTHLNRKERNEGGAPTSIYYGLGCPTFAELRWVYRVVGAFWSESYLPLGFVAAFSHLNRKMRDEGGHPLSTATAS